MLGVVLAAGKGERMQPLSDERPKALLPTLDLPQLHWALAALKAAGVHRAWVNVRGEATLVRQAVEQAGAAIRLDVRVSPEPDEPLGTSGALGQLAAELDETFLLVNADVASGLPLTTLVEAHYSARGPATLVGIPTRSQADFIAEQGWVVQLVDRHRRVGAGHIYAGIGIFEPSVLEYVPAGASHLYNTIMTGLMQSGLGLALHEWTGYWSDIADAGAHLKVNLEALAGALNAPGAAPALRGPVVRWDRLAYVGEGAEVEDVELHHAIVGAGAKVEPGTRLERCVVWDGAVVERAPYQDAVLTGQHVIDAGDEMSPHRGSRFRRAR
jgi:mannose-1-phosphate guanylyltransferase